MNHTFHALFCFASRVTLSCLAADKERDDRGHRCDGDEQQRNHGAHCLLLRLADPNPTLYAGFTEFESDSNKPDRTKVLNIYNI